MNRNARKKSRGRVKEGHRERKREEVDGLKRDEKMETGVKE